jgi:hypothetical protein
MMWELIESLTGKSREDIKHGAGVIAKRLIGVYVCECNHIKGIHDENAGKCRGLVPGPNGTATKSCACSGFKAQTPGG